MEITVKMTVEEFQQFVAWQKEQDYYEKELDKELNKREILAKKRAGPSTQIRRSPARSRSSTRTTRRNCWKWPRITWHKRKATCARCCQHGAGGNIDDGKPSDIPILYQVPGRITSRKKRRGHGPV